MRSYIFIRAGNIILAHNEDKGSCPSMWLVMWYIMWCCSTGAFLSSLWQSRSASSQVSMNTDLRNRGSSRTPGIIQGPVDISRAWWTNIASFDLPYRGSSSGMLVTSAFRAESIQTNLDSSSDMVMVIVYPKKHDLFGRRNSIELEISPSWKQQAVRFRSRKSSFRRPSVLTFQHRSRNQAFRPCPTSRSRDVPGAVDTPNHCRLDMTELQRYRRVSIMVQNSWRSELSCPLSGQILFNYPWLIV